MTTVVYAPNNDPSTFYRLTEPARVTNTLVVERLPHVGNAETVVLNRPLDPGIAEQVRLWRDEGRTVIVDMDDDFDAVVPEHRIHGMYTTEHLHLACKAASVVTCSTPALAQRYGYGRGVVLRNCIPESYLSVRRRTRVDLDGQPTTDPDDGLWVGWYGSLGSHPNDPAAAGRAVGDVLTKVDGAECMHLGPEKDAQPLAETFGMDVRAFGQHSMVGLIQLISEFDIGIVPLERSPFNDAKSYLKGLEFAAVGVPVLASWTPEYRRMSDGRGYGYPPACWLANSPAEWRRQLEKLATKPEWRAQLAQHGREWAATQTYERHADEWRSVWYSRDHATT